MRMSDWVSYGCSSDLSRNYPAAGEEVQSDNFCRAGGCGGGLLSFAAHTAWQSNPMGSPVPARFLFFVLGLLLLVALWLSLALGPLSLALGDSLAAAGWEERRGGNEGGRTCCIR